MDKYQVGMLVRTCTDDQFNNRVGYIERYRMGMYYPYLVMLDGDNISKAFKHSELLPMENEE